MSHSPNEQLITLHGFKKATSRDKPQSITGCPIPTTKTITKARMKRDYINPDPTPPRQDDNSHTGISNEAADIFVVALVFYTLISAIFGASNLNHRGELLRDPQNVRWWQYVGLFMLGWAWPVFCCFICRDNFVARCSGRARRRRREERSRREERRREEMGREREAEDEIRQPDLQSGRQELIPDHRQVGGEDESPGLWRRVLSGLPFWGSRRWRGQDEEVIEARELDITPAVSKSASESRGCEDSSAAAAATSGESNRPAADQPGNPGSSLSDEVQALGAPKSAVKGKGKEKEVS
jgi:hypothetical protein